MIVNAVSAPCRHVWSEAPSDVCERERARERERERERESTRFSYINADLPFCCPRLQEYLLKLLAINAPKKRQEEKNKIQSWNTKTGS